MEKFPLPQTDSADKNFSKMNLVGAPTGIWLPPTSNPLIPIGTLGATLLNQKKNKLELKRRDAGAGRILENV
ncbi:hypothetical protein LEP1GSC047_3917 [Leptospira inadai serovar Lyme str. 10]|uniref:Uncharacterized protein n=1 Tax=Leptospira inadai serovar Lyme str. 10 TaxID=1049790 RepID=V6HLG1_9LEPT|nr:hypothetical protein LEP1GSC047_3425 [Leptospira inadai serovar Lyme str. 10]EQA37730.1 hypothetical protein LEP1GSC047_3917 [Leptospira inadai serovar Lyme str. 10]